MKRSKANPSCDTDCPVCDADPSPWMSEAEFDAVVRKCHEEYQSLSAREQAAISEDDLLTYHLAMAEYALGHRPTVTDDQEWIPF